MTIPVQEARYSDDIFRSSNLKILETPIEESGPKLFWKMLYFLSTSELYQSFLVRVDQLQRL